MTGDHQKQLTNDVTELVKKLGSSKGKELFSSSKVKRVKSIRSGRNKIKKQWKEKDDYRLFRAVKKFGPLWDKVATKFENKTAEECKNRWSHFITTIPVTSENDKNDPSAVNSSNLPDFSESLVTPSSVPEPVSTKISSQSNNPFSNFENELNDIPSLKNQDLYSNYPHLSAMDLGYISNYMTQTNGTYLDNSSKEFQDSNQINDSPHNFDFTHSKEHDFEKLINDCFAKNIDGEANQFNFCSTMPFQNTNAEFNNEIPVDFGTREHGANPFISPHISSGYPGLNQNGVSIDTPNSAFDFSPIQNSTQVQNCDKVVPDLVNLSLPLFFQPENGSKLKNEIVQEDSPMPTFPESFINDSINVDSFKDTPAAYDNLFNPQYFTFLQNELNSPFDLNIRNNQKELPDSSAAQNSHQLLESSLQSSSNVDNASQPIDFETLCNIIQANKGPPQVEVNNIDPSEHHNNCLIQNCYNSSICDSKPLKNDNDLSSSKYNSSLPSHLDASNLNKLELISLAAKIYENPKLVRCLVEISNIFFNVCPKKDIYDVDANNLCLNLNRKRPSRIQGYNTKRSRSQHNSPAVTQSLLKTNESPIFSNQLVTPGISTSLKKKDLVDSSSFFNQDGFVSADKKPCSLMDFFEADLSTEASSQEETLFSYDILRKIREQQIQNQQLVIQAYSIEARFRGPESNWALYWKRQALNIKRNCILGQSYSNVSLDEPLPTSDTVPNFLSFHVIPGAKFVDHILDMIASPPEYLVSYPSTFSPSPAIKKTKNKAPKAQNLAYYFPDNEFCIQGSPRTQVEKARGIHILCKKVFEPIFDSQIVPFFLFTKKRERPIFSSGEDELLRIGLEMYADDWSTIRSHNLPVRPSRQLENRFNNLKSGRQENNLIQKYYINATKPLSEEEDMLLSKGVEIFGKDFREITRHFLPSRPSFFLKRVKRDVQIRKKKAKPPAKSEDV